MSVVINDRHQVRAVLIQKMPGILLMRVPKQVNCRSRTFYSGFSVNFTSVEFREFPKRSSHSQVVKASNGIRRSKYYIIIVMTSSSSLSPYHFIIIFITSLRYHHFISYRSYTLYTNIIYRYLRQSDPNMAEGCVEEQGNG